jgi:hypothetical protein
VRRLLADYAAPWGIVPLVIPPLFPTFHSPLSYATQQKGHDLDFIEHLAEEVGYVFRLQAGPAPGTSVAYWGPRVKLGAPQRALNVDMDVHRNVESLNFNLDADKRVQAVVKIQEPFTKLTIPIPVPEISLLNPPMGAIPVPAHKTEALPGTTHLNPMQALLKGLATASTSADAVTASGTLDSARYGGVLQVGGLVGVRGAGLAFDGLYFVEGVDHEIRRGEYKQSFRLSRNGLVSTLPRVPA